MLSSNVIRVRGGSGLGDSIYLRPVAEYLSRTSSNPNTPIVPLTNYPDIFIGSGLSTEPHQKSFYDILAHYTQGRPNTQTNQWQDICLTAGVPVDLPLQFPWAPRNQRLIKNIRAAAEGKPIIMLNGGRPPMGRTDGYSDEMLPRQKAFIRVLSHLKDCFVVKIGSGMELYSLPSDLDLSNNTTVSDLLDIATISYALVGQCSFMVPLAECFDKPFLGVWARPGLLSRNDFIRQCTPAKILSKASSRFVVDDWQDVDIESEIVAMRGIT